MGPPPDRARGLQHRQERDERWEAFTSTGLQVPADLHAVPRTLWSDPDEPHLDKFYDQIAWFTAADGGSLQVLQFPPDERHLRLDI